MNKIKMQFLTLLVITTVLMFLTTGFSYAEESQSKINIVIDGREVLFKNEAPFIDANGRTQVPFKVALEAFDAEVSWSDITKTAIAIKTGCRSH